MGAAFFVFIFLFPVILVFLAVLFTGVISLLAGLFGGTATALLIKDKNVKRLLQIVCGILLSFSFLCIVPFAGPIAGLSGNMTILACAVAVILLFALSIAGIRFTLVIRKKIIKAALIILFSFTCALSVVVLLILFIVSFIAIL